LKTPLLFITAGPMAGKHLIASHAMIEQARAGGYGINVGVDKIPRGIDRRKPHPAGEAFAAAYADRELRAAMFAQGPWPDDKAKPGYVDRQARAEVTRPRAGLAPETAQPSPGQAPEATARKRGRPPRAREENS
jgi:hypothetical protein